MEQVILEVMKDSGRRADYRVFSGLVIRIGRGYDNDLIINDPHVSEHHCVIRSHEDSFTLEDLSSTNGTMISPGKEKAVGGKVKVQPSVQMHSGDNIFVGNTRLRFLVSGHAVEPARPMVRPNAFFEEISSPLKAWLLVFCALLLSIVIEHQESYKNLPLSKFVSVAIGLLLTILVWTGIWSFVGWLVKRKAFFSAHLSWATLFFLAMTITYPLADHLGYATSSQMVEMAVGSIIFWIFIAFLIIGHLVIATSIARRYQIAVGVAVSMAIVVFGIVTYYAGRTDFNPQPDLYATLVPPYGRLVPGDSVDQFLHKSEKIFLNRAK